MYLREFPLCCGLAIACGVFRECDEEDNIGEYTPFWLPNYWGDTPSKEERWTRTKADKYIFERSYRALLPGELTEDEVGDYEQDQYLPNNFKMVAKLVHTAFIASGANGLVVACAPFQDPQMRQFKRLGFKGVQTQSLHGGTINTLIGDRFVVEPRIQKVLGTQEPANWFPDDLSEQFIKEFVNVKKRWFG